MSIPSVVQVAEEAEAYLRAHPEVQTAIEKVAERKFSELSTKDKCYALVAATGLALLVNGWFLAHGGPANVDLLYALGLEAPLLPLLGKYCKF